MSSFVRAGFSFLKNLGKGGSKTSPTISSTKINVGNLKKNQETLNKLKKTTDAYVTKAGSVDPSLKEALRKAGSKSLQKTEKILRKNRKDGGRMGLKDGSKKSGFGAQSVKYGLDKNYGVTKADKIAKFVSKKNKKKII